MRFWGYQIRINTNKTRIKKWLTWTILKAVPEGNLQIQLSYPILDPPFGGSCGPISEANGPFGGLWAAAGSGSW